MKYTTPQSQLIGPASTLIQNKPYSGSDNHVPNQPTPMFSNLLEAH